MAKEVLRTSNGIVMSRVASVEVEMLAMRTSKNPELLTLGPAETNDTPRVPPKVKLMAETFATKPEANPTTREALNNVPAGRDIDATIITVSPMDASLRPGSEATGDHSKARGRIVYDVLAGTMVRMNRGSELLVNGRNVDKIEFSMTDSIGAATGTTAHKEIVGTVPAAAKGATNEIRLPRCVTFACPRVVGTFTTCKYRMENIAAMLNAEEKGIPPEEFKEIVKEIGDPALTRLVELGF